MLSIAMVYIDFVNQLQSNEMIWLGYEFKRILNKRNVELTEISISETELTNEIIKTINSQDAVVFVFSSETNSKHIQKIKDLLFNSYPILYNKIVGTILFSEEMLDNDLKILNDIFTEYQLINGAQIVRLLPLNKLIEMDENHLKNVECIVFSFIKDLFNLSWSKKYIQEIESLRDKRYIN